MSVGVILPIETTRHNVPAPGPDRADLASASDQAAGGTARRSDPSPPGANGRTAETPMGPSAHAPLSFAACHLYEELLRRLRRRGFDWE